MINPDLKEIYHVPKLGDVMYIDARLHQYEYSNKLRRADWFEVPTDADCNKED